MAFVDVKNKEVLVKIVYYGPGRGGKTTNLEFIYSRIRDRVQKEMVSIKTHGDRTLFFDFLPFDIGAVKGYNARIQLFTVPGQVRYNTTRKMVLRGVDGVVFVADSMTVRREKNMISLKNLQTNLAAYNKSIFRIPLVLQYNKRDLAEQGFPLLSLERIEADLNRHLQAPAFPASALRGENVWETLKKIIQVTMTATWKKLR